MSKDFSIKYLLIPKNIQDVPKVTELQTLIKNISDSVTFGTPCIYIFGKLVCGTEFQNSF